jgi:hypothetical protein
MHSCDLSFYIWRNGDRKRGRVGGEGGPNNVCMWANVRNGKIKKKRSARIPVYNV